MSESDESVVIIDPPPTLDQNSQEEVPSKRRRLVQASSPKPQPTECSICFDPCTRASRHRLVALKCGHVFGKKCIERWIKERKTCPNCHINVRRNDIRVLFTDHVAVVDTSGTQAMETKYLEEKQKRIEMETTVSRLRLQLEMAQAEVKRCREEMEEWKKQRIQGEYKELWRYPLMNARVSALSSLYVCVGDSISSTCHGLIKLSLNDTRHCRKLITHTSPIRDISLHPQESLALTVAFDGKLVVSNLESETVVLTIPLPKRQGWSCSFSKTDPFALYCGFQDGTIAQYDMRRSTTDTTNTVAIYSLPMRQPVHAIHVNTVSPYLVAASFSGFGTWHTNENQPEESIPCSQFVSVPSCCSLATMSTKPETVLITTRSSTIPAKHMIYDINTSVEPRMTRTGFRTSPLLSRPALWENPYGKTMIASWDEDSKHVKIWNESHVEPTLLPGSGNNGSVVDLKHGNGDGKLQNTTAILSVLAPKELVMWKV